MKRNWIIAGAVAAMMATAMAGASAQTADTTTPSATTPMTTPSDSGAMPMSMPMSSDAPDYSLLANPLFNYGELKSAKAKGLSDDQIASILRITKLTGMPFRDTVDKVLTGKTLPTLAYDYNLKISDVTDNETEKQQIASYLAAYESTGTMALKASPNADMAMSSGMTNSGSMDTTGTSTSMMATKDVVDTAMSDKRFKTLVKLLKQANLVDTLKGAGPFTVFAPTDAAFKKLPKDTIKNLSNDQLTKILTYHVIPQKVDAATAMAMTSPTSPPTVEGSTLQVTTSNGTVMVNDAKVTQADIQASNGIIHAIDTVLMPPDLSMDTTGTTPATSDTGTTGMGTGTSTDTVPAGGATPTPDAGGTTPAAPPAAPAGQ